MGYAFKTKSGDTSIANDIKEKLTYVARDFNSEMEVPVSAGIIYIFVIHILYLCIVFMYCIYVYQLCYLCVFTC